MKIYLVGGAIRDQLLGLPIKERDWVIVGGSPEELIAAGYQPVGKDFPVFLHPETFEEYALARTERKIAKGYKGFKFHTAANVTLEEDLKRRDLTINAMAEDAAGKLCDPYNGQQDLKQKILRHVSLAFAEDPVRILRLARFAAKLPEFSVADETNTLMKKMVENGEVDALVPERVWQELSRALNENVPIRFFQILNNCGALEKLFPGIQINSPGIVALKNATQLNYPAAVRFAALLHHLAEAEVKYVCNRYRAPSDFSELVLLTCHWHTSYAKIDKLSIAELLNLLKRTDSLRRYERFMLFLQTCKACHPEHDHAFNLLKNAANHLKKLDITSLQEKKLVGKYFADALHELQIRELKKILNQQCS